MRIISLSLVLLGGGNTLTLGAGGLAQNSASLQTLSHALTLGTAQTWSLGAGGLTLSGVLGGGGALVKTGAGTLTLGGTGANTQSGTVTIEAGTLVLAKSVNVNAIAGPLIIGGAGGSATVRIGAASQIPDTASVTVLGGGTLELTNFSDIIGTLTLDATTGAAAVTSTGANLGLTSATMTGGSITTPGAFFSLNFQGSSGPALTTLASAQSATLAGRIGFGGTRGFVVADGPAAVDLDIAAVILGGSGNVLDKQGPGTLRLSAANLHNGGTILTAGTLALGHDNALGTGALTVAVGATAPRLEADAAPRTLANAVTLGSTLTLGGAHALTFTGTIGGSGGLVKADAATLTLAGAAANTFAGLTTVQAGTLVLGKTAGLNAIGGSLGIGGGGTPAIARLGASHQLPDTASVTVSGNGTFDMNGQSETIGALVLEPGTGPFATGPGTLAVTGITMTGGSLSGNIALGSAQSDGITTLASATTATITGSLDHAGDLRSYSVADGAADIDLDLTGAGISGGVFKTGAGTLRVVGTASFNQLTLSAGTVALGSDFFIEVRFAGVDSSSGAIRADGAARTVSGGLAFDTSSSSVFVTGSHALTFTGNLDIGSGSRIFRIDNTAITTFSGGIAGRALEKKGAGVLMLSSPNGNGYSGITIINEGTLRVSNTSGSATGFGAVDVQSRLEGAGSIAGPVVMGVVGVVAPGIGLGSLNVGKFDMQVGFGTLEIELGGTTAGTLYDQLLVTDTAALSSDGTVILGGSLALSLVGGFDPQAGDLFYILLNDGADAIGGTFSNAHGAPHPLAPGFETLSLGGETYAVSYTANWTGDPLTSTFTGGNDAALLVVPEPATAALLLAGLGTLLARRRRR